MHGTVPGTAVLTSTMARLSDQHKTMSVDRRDSSQAWAVISGVANTAQAHSAMNAVQKRLVRPNDKLIQLFDPPFDKGSLSQVISRGTFQVSRENGGQYTHAATWVVLATALQGDGDRALELWNLINPVYHAATLVEVQRYKVEPYVVCADVYGAPPHSGRGGWTSYAGSDELAVSRCTRGDPRLQAVRQHAPYRAMHPAYSTEI